MIEAYSPSSNHPLLMNQPSVPMPSSNFKHHRPRAAPSAKALLGPLHAAIAAEGQRTPTAVRGHEETHLHKVARGTVVPHPRSLRWEVLLSGLADYSLT